MTEKENAKNEEREEQEWKVKEEAVEEECDV